MAQQEQARRQSPSHFATGENGRTLSIVPADWQRNEREKWFVRRRAVYIRLYHEEIILHGHGLGMSFTVSISC